jgi:hypothetical protein
MIVNSMIKQAVALTILLFASIIFCGIQPQTIRAQVTSTIHILSDGIVYPSTAPISQTGNTYKATANINSPIVIEKNNIVLDGQGFTIQSSGGTNTQAAINLTCTCVTVKNFHIDNWQVGILGAFDNNKVVGNEFTGNTYDIAVYGRNYDIAQNFLCYLRIVGSNIHVHDNKFETRTYGSAFWISNSTGITIEANDFTFTSQTTSFVSIDSNSNIQVYHNNFLSGLLPSRGQSYFFGMAGISDLDPWDNGNPSGGNYWSDYSVKYSNASMIDDSGIWNQSYLVQGAIGVVDRYPLCSPYELHVLPHPTPAPSVTVEDTPTPTPTPSVPEFSIWAMVLLPAILLVAGVYRKRIMEKPMDTVYA